MARGTCLLQTLEQLQLQMTSDPPCLLASKRQPTFILKKKSARSVNIPNACVNAIRPVLRLPEVEHKKRHNTNGPARHLQITRRQQKAKTCRFLLPGTKTEA